MNLKISILFLVLICALMSFSGSQVELSDENLANVIDSFMRVNTYGYDEYFEYQSELSQVEKLVYDIDDSFECCGFNILDVHLSYANYHFLIAISDRDSVKMVLKHGYFHYEEINRKNVDSFSRYLEGYKLEEILPFYIELFSDATSPVYSLTGRPMQRPFKSDRSASAPAKVDINFKSGVGFVQYIENQYFVYKLLRNKDMGDIHCVSNKDNMYNDKLSRTHFNWGPLIEY